MNEENKNLNENGENAENIDTSENVEAAEATEASETTEAAEAVEKTVFIDTTDSAKESKKNPTGIIIGIIVLIVVIAAAVLCKMYGSVLFNKYNRMGYVDTSGQTIADVADSMGMTLEEFKERFELPDDMPANTVESTAFYMVPTGIIAGQYGTDFDTLKAELQLGDEVTEDTPWGEAEGTIKVGVYVPEEQMDAWKEYYGFGDEVTADTLWKDVRNKIDQKTKEDNEAAEKAREKAENATEAPVEESTEAPADEADSAPAADAAATEAPAQQ